MLKFFVVPLLSILLLLIGMLIGARMERATRPTGRESGVSMDVKDAFDHLSAEEKQVIYNAYYSESHIGNIKREQGNEDGKK